MTSSFLALYRIVLVLSRDFPFFGFDVLGDGLAGRAPQRFDVAGFLQLASSPLNGGDVAADGADEERRRQETRGASSAHDADL
ncbi:hypothetical protein [Aneurinibacillus danicus]|uniref:hypothetical protein n=1 Tax=Aneurinibacillus danicus TaxID=267746 RepID=UPI001479612E|nr:hypothetical protein [Aneurinibacillus danicus]